MKSQCKAKFDHDPICCIRECINKHDPFLNCNILKEELGKIILHLCFKKIYVIAADQNDSLKAYKRFILHSLLLNNLKYF